MYKNSFGERLKNARIMNKMSQEEVAKTIKKSRSTIACYESGKREPDIETIGKLAVLYGYTTDYFFGLASD